MSDDFGSDTRKLELLLKMLKNPPSARVGILGSKNQRDKNATTNAEIGMKHEFGDTTTKQRSFLRVPLMDNFQKYLEKAGFNEKVLIQAIEQKTLEPLAAKIGIVGETVVADAFATGGFGKWAPHAPGYENNTGQVLVDTQQLRNSITSDVEGSQGNNDNGIGGGGGD